MLIEIKVFDSFISIPNGIEVILSKIESGCQADAYGKFEFFLSNLVLSEYNSKCAMC